MFGPSVKIEHAEVRRTVSRRGLLLFAAMCVIWGMPYLLIRVAVSEISPVALVFIRTALAALILLPFVVARGGIREIGSRWPALLIFAGVEVAGPWFFLSSAERHISSALTGLLISAVPLVGVVIATALGNREHLGIASVSGLLLGIAGVALIVGSDLHVSDATALIEIGLAVVGSAIGPVILSRYLSRVPSVTVIGVALAICALAYAPSAAWSWPHMMPSVNALGAVGLLAAVSTAIGFLLFFELIAEVGPVRATMITYINPAIAAILGVALLHEHFTIAMGIGFALVLLGSTLAARTRRLAEGQSRPIEVR